MELEITATGTIRLNVVGEFSVEEVKHLLARIAQARSQIANEPGSPVDLPIPTVVSPGWHTQLASDGAGSNTFLAFRHPGFGWVGFTMPPVHRVQLAACLIAQQGAAMASAAKGIVADPGPDGTEGKTMH